MNYILDTCVISELIKPRPDANVVSWVDNQTEANLYLTSITIGEIQRGIFKLPKSQKRSNLQEWFRNELLDRFDRRILGYGLDESIMWGQIQASAEKSGIKMPILNGIIASIALVHNMTIATRNIGDMHASGAALINPWE